MSQEEIVVRYDGPALQEHAMDVEALAPALLALADLCKSVNEKYNGERASVNLLIRADVEQQCFQIKFQLFQTVLKSVRSLLDDEKITTAKEIFEWLGILKGPALGLFGLLKGLKGRQPDQITMTVENGNNVAQINVQGDVYIADPRAVELLKDSKILTDAAKVTAPNLREGYDNLEFRQNGRTVESFTKEDARAIAEMRASSIEPTSVLPESTVRATVKIRRAVYDGVGKWTIQHEKSRDVAMLDTEWLGRFQRNEVEAPPGSLLDVEMRVSEIELDAKNNPISDPDYSIVKVYNEIPPPKVPDLFVGEH